MAGRKPVATTSKSPKPTGPNKTVTVVGNAKEQVRNAAPKATGARAGSAPGKTMMTNASKSWGALLNVPGSQKNK
jgi:hypothetical protein